METNISSHQSQLQQTATGQEMEPKGIVLNRMYTGSYLSTNLGHEVINMFQADNGKHYLYLNARGNFSKEGKQVNTMLLVRHIGGSTVEAVGMAKNLNVIESAHCSLPRDLGIIDKNIKNQQVGDKGLGIKYKGISIENIFGSEGQQNIYASYWVKNCDFYTPKKNKRIIIELTKKDTKQPIIQKTKNIKKAKLKSNFGSTSLHQYIFEEEDLASLNKLCDLKNNYWEQASKKVDIPEDLKEDKVSLFDICQIQKDENRISNALSYFIDKYPKLWREFFEEQLKQKELGLGEIESVTREEDAKVEGMANTGGRIDLLVRTKNFYIIIENKIDSPLIIDTKTNISQITRYYNYVEYLKDSAIGKINENIKNIENLQSNISEINSKLEKSKTPNGPRAEKWNLKIKELKDKIDELKKDLNLLNARKTIGFVLAPDYNMPSEAERQIKNDEGKTCYTYQELRYSMIYNWIEKNAQEELSKDDNFKAFHNTIKRHTYEYENQSLYEDMKTAFFTRIKNLRSQNQDNNA